ncbi:predicted protein [Plenodomus lingam JN3]|uniref:Predicted protein n=1 Tax=Leptosphaeria maculans (strain JN3 / isolate v23.1.3 / race Av1-4-5-6-7-8) TaxID=985895 RepID=E4ZXT4_LEPMJ|nr:predicted protein [Plenodomus lingam JN3]CBX96179.1 predicted protein [Plenodomus lingam JN3]
MFPKHAGLYGPGNVSYTANYKASQSCLSTSVSVVNYIISFVSSTASLMLDYKAPLNQFQRSLQLRAQRLPQHQFHHQIQGSPVIIIWKSWLIIDAGQLGPHNRKRFSTAQLESVQQLTSKARVTSYKPCQRESCKAITKVFPGYSLGIAAPDLSVEAAGAALAVGVPPVLASIGKS